ncbi:putative von willebrand factor protein [Botrytis fragariae]|uniref:Putative von willebrand factor protein n=1 Tax=Botrytis fragariae TaxID=1964551 RepID=A0A8H6EPF5_9HELO|nr:putative von willebrand factor protein [Botrytis fragariae]KAF5879678.1 putative von willebrand factor protein [Botrytis fragariae]
MSFNSQNHGSDLKRKSGLLGSIRDKLGRSKSTAPSKSPLSFPRGIPDSAPPQPILPHRQYLPLRTTRHLHPYTNASTSQNNSPTFYSSNTFASRHSSTVPNTAGTLPQHDLDGSPYALLSTFDTVLLIDDSTSMGWYTHPTAWEQVFFALQTIAPIITTYDADGIDVYFMNHKSKHKGNENEGIAGTGYYNIQNAASVEERAKKELKAGREVKPLNLIVITDGAASDDPESEIVKVARELDDLDAPLTQVGIQFFQVGRVAEAKQALEDLDDALEHRYKIRDMVDTVTWNGRDTEAGLTGDGIVKAVLGAIIKRLDHKPASGEIPRN